MRRYSVVGSVLLVVLAAPGPVHGAGFAILEQSAARNGMALAGSRAAAEDASTVWFNPAGMTRRDSELQLAAHLIVPQFEFNDRGSVQTTPLGSLPLLPGADRSEDGAERAVVPNAAYVRAINERWRLGIVLNAPFGLSTGYASDWVGRYQAVDSEITSFNVNPAVAYRVNDRLSLGAGVSVNYTEARLTNAVDFAAICAQLAGDACPNGALPGQGAFDGFVENTGDDTSVGYNLGLLWQPTNATRLGLTYRSEIEHNLEGDVDFTAPATLGGFEALGPMLGGALAAAFADGNAGAELTLPDTAGASIRHDIENGFAAGVTLLAEAVWTGWSNLSALRIDSDNPATPPLEETLAWENTWRFAVGLECRVNAAWQLRAGIAYDESPVPNQQLRTPRLPDNDRTWLALGLGRTWRHGTIDVGYAHLVVDDTPIDRVGGTGDRLRGDYDSAADVFSVEVGFDF